MTGFGPFMGIEDNPSGWLAARSGKDHAILPVTWADADQFIQNFPADQYDGLLLTGVAAGRTHLTPEFFAYNLVGPHADVNGVQRPGPIDPDGPSFWRATLWDVDTVGKWIAEETTLFSLHPGTYLCNYIFYRALQHLPGFPVGFLHVPGDDQMNRPDQLERFQTILASFA